MSMFILFLQKLILFLMKKIFHIKILSTQSPENLS